MRRLSPFILVLVAWIFAGLSLHAQEIIGVQAGFKPLGDEKGPTHKVGLWSPLAIRCSQPPAGRGFKTYTLLVDAEDSEDFTVRWSSPASETQPAVITVPFKPGRTRGDLRVSLQDSNGTIIAGPPPDGVSAGVNSFMYASLGARLGDLAEALTLKERRAAEDGKFVAPPNRFAVYEDAVDFLPENFHQAYESYDLVVLNTGNREFLTGLIKTRARPLAAWLHNGGRLAIALDPNNADLVQQLLAGLVDVAVSPEALAFKNLAPVESWAGLQDKPFPARGESAALVTKLRLGPGWEVLAEIYDKKLGDRPAPLIARMPVGFGALTLIAFPLDGGAFSRWGGRVDFLRAMVDQLGPRYQTPEKTKSTAPGDADVVGDWGTQLHRELDVFDVTTPSFGTVALLMLGYILLVSVVDHAVLKRLGRLDATWITLPVIALGVCALVYWALAPGDDRQFRTNALALVDYSDSQLARPTTFITVRSPSIAELSLSTPQRDGFFPPALLPDLPERLVNAHLQRPKEASDPVISWFGRPDDGPAGMGRAGSQSFGTKTYSYLPGLDGLRQVPFAYRATKAFVSSNLSAAAPVTTDLVYHPRTHHLKVSGTLDNRFPCDLEDAYLFVFDRAYPIEGGLKAGQKVTIAIREIEPGLLPGEWRDRPDRDRPTTSRGVYNPCLALRNIMFHERLDSRLAKSNHLFRPLDWSWRLRDDPRVVNVPISSLGMREAILVARAKFVAGEAAKLAEDRASPLPTVLRVGEGPDGLLSQDTYIRVIVPMRPQG